MGPIADEAAVDGPELSAEDRRLLEGGGGEAARIAMRIIVRLARVTGAPRLIDITSAHIDSCLYHGRAGLDFAQRLAGAGGRVAVATTLNVSSLDLLHPGLYRGDPETAANARALMDAYVAMGCQATWTCAPYQLARRPAFGEQIAWAESNAIVFANSVLGARTQRYGDFIDICAALTGRVPDGGLHRAELRRGQVVFRVAGLPRRLLDEDVLYPVLGHIVGKRAGSRIPVLDGLPAELSEDRLKALGAAAASSGSVALFHAVGSTPEAATLDDALQGGDAEDVVTIDAALVRQARDELSTVDGDELTAVSIGTPHFSLTEFERLMPLLDGFRPAGSVDFYVSTARDTLAVLRERGWAGAIEEAGLTVVVDTCTYITPILPRKGGVVMTNSAKWAYYAPGNLGVDVVFGSLEECVRSAAGGRVWRDPSLWDGL